MLFSVFDLFPAFARTRTSLVADVSNISDIQAVDDDGQGSRRPASGHRLSSQGTVPAVWLLIISLGFTAAIFGPENLPLGVDGEWLWTRHPLPEDLTSFLDRCLPALVAAAALMIYTSILERRINEFKRPALAAALLVLTLLTGYWQSSVLQTASTPHRELRPLWVLYDKYATGYFLQAVQEPRSTLQVLQEYETEMSDGDVLHKGTHPPGLFLFNRLALWCTASSPSTWSQLPQWMNVQSITTFRRLEAEAALAAPLQPPQFAALILTSIVSFWASACLPATLFTLLAQLTSRRDAWRFAVLAATLPAISVFQPRSDVLYAVSGLVLLLLLTWSVRQHSLICVFVSGCLAGFWMFVCLLVSLAHVPIVIAAAFFWLFSLFGARGDANTVVSPSVTGGSQSFIDGTSRTRLFLAALATDLAFSCSLWAFSFSTGCNMLSIWTWNLKNHAAFYGQFPRTWWKWLPVNVLEMMLSVGLPVCLVVVYGIIRVFVSSKVGFNNLRNLDTGDDGAIPGGRPLARFNFTPLRQLSISLAVTWILLLVSGKNMGEAARLWCFITPWWLVLLADVGLPGLTASANRRIWVWLLFCQLLVCAMTTARVNGYLQM